MSAVFFIYFGAIGALHPFLSLYYKNLGLTGTEISLLMSVSPVLLFISQPLFGPLADRSGHRGRMLSWLMVVVAITGGLAGLGLSFWTMLPLITLWSFFAGPVTPLADSIALGEVQRTGVSYPQLRLWGSVGFLVMTTLMGRLYTQISMAWAFPLYCGMLLVGALFARRLPAEGISGQRPVWPELKRLLSNPSLLAFLVLCGLMQATQAAHSAFFSLRLEEIGGSSSTVGLAWALAAFTEVPVWLVLGKVTKRVGPLPLLALAGAVFAGRWWLYGVVTVPSVLVGLGLLQAFSFAIFMPTAVVFVGELTPPDLRTSGQALLVLINGGVATVLGTLGAGRIVDEAGTGPLYQAMAFVALASGLGFLLLVARRWKQAGKVAEHG